jgi:hypothetical protein
MICSQISRNCATGARRGLSLACNRTSSTRCIYAFLLQICFSATNLFLFVLGIFCNNFQFFLTRANCCSRGTKWRTQHGLRQILKLDVCNTEILKTKLSDVPIVSFTRCMWSCFAAWWSLHLSVDRESKSLALCKPYSKELAWVCQGLGRGATAHNPPDPH